MPAATLFGRAFAPIAFYAVASLGRRKAPRAKPEDGMKLCELIEQDA